jgi:hypothetical protein
MLEPIGTEGTEAITHINTNNDGKYVSICERNTEGKKGIVTIYEVISSKRRQTLPDAPDQANRFKSQEFLCAAFAPRKEEFIVTLCGAPDWQIMLWDWEKCRLMSQIALGLNIPQSVKTCSFQVTFNPNDLSSESILLTGPCNTFKYIKKDGDHNLNTSHTQINNMDPGKKISPNFTCHSWSQETGHILVCTDNGEMIICENSGDYKAYIMDANPGRSIEAVVSLS